MKLKEALLNEESDDKMWDEMAKLLKNHDWMYSMASGPAYYKGLEEHNKILALRKKLRNIDKKKLIDLYKKNVPKHVLAIFASDWEKNI